MKLFVALVFFGFIALFGLRTASAQSTSRDPACCSCSGGYPTNNCNSANNVGGVLTANCGTGCDGCPTCRKRPNPAFTKECTVNMVFIIDNSGSLESFCAPIVRPALNAFFDGLQNVVNTGGAIQTAIITFSVETQLVFPMTTVTPTFVSQAKAWVAGSAAPGNTHPGYCKLMGGTNWGNALDFTEQQNYGVEPDIYLFFSDGYPQCAGTYVPQRRRNGVAESGCSKSCYNENDSFFNTLCNPSSSCEFGSRGLSFADSSDDTPSGTWSACYFADKLKARGGKLFFIGIGGLNSHESKIQLVSGTSKWDGLPQKFGTSDYVISTDLNNMAIIFQQVLAGLCNCLQGQPICINDGAVNSCAATRFSAYARVTTDATTSSTVFPAASQTSAFLYYNFVASPDTRVAWEFWSAGTPITGAATVVRTDTLNPCAVERRVACTTNCYKVQEAQYLPRFFREQGDTPCPGGVTCSGATYAPVQCQQGFIKGGNPSNDEAIRFFWTAVDDRTPCAAETVDGTLYEFFSSNAGLTAGVIGLGQPPRNVRDNTLWDFDPVGVTCDVRACPNAVELVIVIDEQDIISDTTYDAMRAFVGNLVGRLAPAPYSNDTKFGVVFTNSYGPPFPQAPVSLVGLSDPPNFVTNIINFHNQERSPTSDFPAAITYALNKYWGGRAPNGVKRNLLVMVGGPDSGTANYGALQSLYTTYEVEAFVVGVDRGAGNLVVLNGLASPGSFVHYVGVIAPADLNAGGGYDDLMTQNLCPQTNVCGASCLGFCECGTLDTCKCPACIDEVCTVFGCSSGATGCLAQPRNCDDNDLCTTDSCTPTGGCLNTPVTCQAGAVCVNSTGECITGGPCTDVTDPTCQNTACYNQQCINNICVITSTTNCNDNNACTVDRCVNPTGCDNAPLVCDQSASTCFDITCEGTLPNGQPDCRATDPINCNDNDSCTIDSCVERFGCQSKNITCSPQGNNECSFPVGCIGKDDQGNEIQSPQCIDSNASCVRTTISPGVVAGISAGIIAGVIIAAVIVALLIAFFSKKGYDAYQASSAMSTPSMHENPTFKDNANVAYTKF